MIDGRWSAEKTGINSQPELELQPRIKERVHLRMGLDVEKYPSSIREDHSW